MKIVFTWDDGAPEDKKLFALHEKYEIPGLFFVPTKNCEGRDVLSPQDIREASGSPFLTFGGHTASHRYLTSVPLEEVAGELVDNKNYLEDILGTEVPHFCLPGGKYTPEILDEAFRYYRTVRTADTMNFKNQDCLIKPTFHFYHRGKKSLLGNAWRNRSYGPLVRTLLDNGDYFSVIEHLVEYAEHAVPNAQIIFWGHSWELEKFDLWKQLESLMAHLAEKQDNVCVPYSALMP